MIILIKTAFNLFSKCILEVKVYEYLEILLAKLSHCIYRKFLCVNFRCVFSPCILFTHILIYSDVTTRRRSILPTKEIDENQVGSCTLSQNAPTFCTLLEWRYVAIVTAAMRAKGCRHHVNRCSEYRPPNAEPEERM